MSKHVRVAIAVIVLANVAVLAFLLLRTPTDGKKPGDLGDVLKPMLVDETMQTARYDLADRKDELNIILISMDALRYDRTGFGGSKKGLTPNLDAFAEEAIVFDNVTASASWTLPSHMSIWTGRWPSVHGVTNKLKILGKDQLAETTLSTGIETYPNLLVKNGWIAGGFTGGAGMGGQYGFDRGFETFVGDRPFAGMDYSAPKAVDWLKEHRSQRFLLVLHGYDSHGQYPLAESSIKQIPYEGTLNGSIEEQASLREKGLEHIDKPGAQADLTGTVGPEDAKFLEDIYDRKVRDADQRVGTFLQQVKSMGLMDNTIIAIMSDHGDEFMDHGNLDHGHTLYQEQLHTVLMLRLPGYARQQRVSTNVRSLDLFPTIFDLLGLQGPEGVNGQSLLPLLRGDEEKDTVYSETDYRLYVHHRTIRQGDYKLILDLRDGGRELYNLKDDPTEQKDLSSIEPRRVYEMEQALKTWMLDHGQNPQDYLNMEQDPISIF